MEEFEAMLNKMANLICHRLPKGYLISLNFEEGSAWVDLEHFDLDYTDKSLVDQIDEALSLCLSNENPEHK